MNKEDILKILEGAKDKNGDVPMRLVRQAFEKLPEPCTGTISRQAAIDAVDSETVSTNPEHFKSSEKFIKFMDDADIASFGKWQWANGFNTAVVAAKIQLKKLPSAQPEIIRCKDCKWWSNDDYRECSNPNYDDGYVTPAGFYCGYAERRTDERTD